MTATLLPRESTGMTSKVRAFWTTFDLIVKTYDMKEPPVFLIKEQTTSIDDNGQYYVSEACLDKWNRHWLNLHRIRHYHTTGVIPRTKKEMAPHMLGALKEAYWALPTSIWMEMITGELAPSLTSCKADNVDQIRDLLAILNKVGFNVTYGCVKLPRKNICFIYIKIAKINSEAKDDIYCKYYAKDVEKPGVYLNQLHIYLSDEKFGSNFDHYIGLDAKGIKDFVIKHTYEMHARCLTQIVK